MNLDWLAIGLFCCNPWVFGLIVAWGACRILDKLGLVEA